MITKMETELKEIKQSVVFTMEKKIDELKASLLVMFEQHAKKEKSFSAVVLGIITALFRRQLSKTSATVQ